MKKLIVEELCKKYNEDEKVINILMNISFQEGFLLYETIYLLELFYSK